MKIMTLLSVAAAALLVGASSASAALVDITLTGDVESVHDFNNVFGLGAEAVGSAANITDQAFVETFYLNTAGGNVVDTPTLVSYNSIFGAGPPYALGASLTINGHTFSTVGSNFSSVSISPTDYQGGSNDVVPGGSRLNNEFDFDLNAPAGSGLPTSVTEPFSLAIDGSAIIPYVSFIDETSGGEYPDAIGTLDPTELTVSLVSSAPEPSAWLMMMTGVLMAGGLLRRAKTALGLDLSAA